MSKLLIKTTGQFELVDYADGTVIRYDRPTVVTDSSFISARTANGQLRVLNNLSDEATDIEFEKYFKESDGDADLAISAFIASFTPERETTDVKPRGRPAKVA